MEPDDVSALETRPPAAPTLEEVAALAGVSRSTVSRVVNKSPHVTDEAVAAVTKAIADLGYVPNRAARTLASRRTQVIALVFPESTARIFADPFFAAVTQGITLFLADTDYTLNMVVASESRPEKTRRFLTTGNVDGALVVSHHSGDHSYADLGPLPLVFGGRPMRPAGHPTHYVDSDNVGGAETAVRHLLDVGRRRIAVIAGPLDMPPGIDRLEGARAAGDGTIVEVAHGDFSPASGAAAAKDLLARGTDFDAVFAANDQMAVGAISELVRAGRRVPEDVAVVGFDDDWYGRSSTPPLTTLHQDPAALGARMAATVIDLIEGHEAEWSTILPTELVVRASSTV